MLRKILGILSLSLLGLFLDFKSENAILHSIESQYQQDLDHITKAIQELENMAVQWDASDIEQLRSLLTEARLQYKTQEHLIEYFQKEHVYRYINGAPLPKQVTSAPEIEIIDPNGLQTLDELIYSDAVYEEKEAIKNLASDLLLNWESLRKFERLRNIQHRYVFEATRFQLIRIFNLGLTGFDTPGSVNAINEALASLNSMVHTYKGYYGIAKNKTEIKLLEDIIINIEAFISYLESNNDFDSLDRLFILKTYFNPLYQGIYALQKAFNIEFIEEVDKTSKAVSYHTQDMFDENFLNKSYYAQIANVDLEDPKKIELGKLLFFDPALSRDINMSCATCHDPKKAFTDGLPKSKSNKPGETTLRNSPTIINSVYAEKYFYDLREYDLERQVKHVVYDKAEFNMDFIELAERLKTSEEYSQLFKEAYGERDKYGISSWSISNALSAYVSSLSSWNSEFDQYARGEIDSYSKSAQRGFNLFMGKAACGTCHFAPTFNGTVPPNYKESESEVLGVLAQYDTLHPVLDGDPGRIMSGRAYDEAGHYAFAFKTVTVRNIELTAPYMHNGSIDDLETVLDFYNRGGGAGMGLDLDHQTLPDARLELTKQEQEDIIAFMKTLTDTVGMTSIPSVLPEFESHPDWSSRLDY